MASTADHQAVASGGEVPPFGERLTHTDALYFAVTVFSTVGFGVILGAVGRGRQRQQGDGGGAPPAG